MRSGLSAGKLIRLARQAIDAVSNLRRDSSGNSDGRSGRTGAPSSRDASGRGRGRQRPHDRSDQRDQRDRRDRRDGGRRDTTGSGGRPAASDGELEGTRFEYSPTLDGDPDPGEVVWTWVPYEDDPRQGKDRPVVVIGRRGPGLVGVALTSKRHDNEPQFEVGTGPWDREGRPSYAKLERVLDIDPAQVRREGAVLAKTRFDELVVALRRLHERRERPR